MQKHSPHLYLFAPMLGLFAMNGCQLDPKYLPWLLELEQSIENRRNAPRAYPTKPQKPAPSKPKFSYLERQSNTQAYPLRPCLNHILDIGHMRKKQREWRIIKRNTCAPRNRL
jgi:hypothetical protein